LYVELNYLPGAIVWGLNKIFIRKAITYMDPYHRALPE